MLKILMFLSPLLMSGCRSHAPVQANGEPCIRVRYVTGVCLEVVLEIRDAEFYHFGERWQQFNHVFRTTVPCGSEELLESGKDFYVVMLAKPDEAPPCIRCRAALDYSGEKNYPVRLLKRCP